MAAPPVPVSSASLYVGDLDRDVTEAQLYELFSQAGPVASIRVCRDAVTRRSLGYAYVNYNSTMDETAAERALEALNYQVVNGKAMRIMWSHRDPSARRSGVGNIFIKNLDESIDNKALHDTFTAFGNILSCKIAMNADGQSRGFGFVHFETEEAANLAIEKVNGMLLEGKKVFVGKFLKRSERDTDQTQQKFTNIFVKNLEPEVTEEMLHEKFSQYGVITNLVIMRDDSGKSKGFGFVNFESADAAKAAVETLNNSQIGSKSVFVGRAQKKSEREQMLRLQFEEKRQERIQKYQGVNLYIKNLDETVDEDMVREEFSTFGTITSVKVMTDEKGNHRGFGFVCFNSPEEATKAVAEVNGRMINGKPVYVALAQRKEVRKAQLEQQYALRMPTGLPAPPVVPATLRPGAPGPPMYPAGAPLFYAAPPGVMPGPVPQRQGIMYQPMMPRAWRPGPPAMRPSFQPVPAYGQQVPMNARGPRQNRQRPNGQQGGQQPSLPQQPPQSTQQMPAQPPSMQASAKDVSRNPSRNQRQQYKYVPNGRMAPNGAAAPLAASAPVPQMVPLVPVPVAVPGAPVSVTPIASTAVTLPLGPMPGPQEALTSTMLAAAPHVQQKQMLGERLFPLIQRHQPELAGKVTGMLLEMDNTELLLLLESPEALVQKIDEALLVLQQHGGGHELSGNSSRGSVQETMTGPLMVEARG